MKKRTKKTAKMAKMFFGLDYLRRAYGYHFRYTYFPKLKRHLESNWTADMVDGVSYKLFLPEDGVEYTYRFYSPFDCETRVREVKVEVEEDDEN